MVLENSVKAFYQVEDGVLHYQFWLCVLDIVWGSKFYEKLIILDIQ